MPKCTMKTILSSQAECSGESATSSHQLRKFCFYRAKTMKATEVNIDNYQI